MRMDYQNKQDSWLGFLYVNVIVRSHGSNVVYKLYYLCGVVMTFKVRNCQSNHVSSFDNLYVRLMLSPAVFSNAAVSLKDQLSKQ